MENKEKTYMVVDLKDWSVSYLSDVPTGGWTDEYKTEKLVLRYIPAGTFMMGSPEDELGREKNEYQHKVTLTRPFYMGVFQVTQSQYELVTGNNPSKLRGKTRPVEQVSYAMIRGEKKGLKWPENDLVDDDSFIGILRKKLKLNFDLPTEAQWEYACRAETTTALNSGDNLTDDKECQNMAKVGRYHLNGGVKKEYDPPESPEDIRSLKRWGFKIFKRELHEDEGHVAVGSYLPNNWGLYDMHGNVWEWCLDYYDVDNYMYKMDATDPKGIPTNKGGRVIRGGSFWDAPCACRSAARPFLCHMFADVDMNGFRLALII
jgi:formylglycine-generating enzyme required for sulfatase activity